MSNPKKTTMTVDAIKSIVVPGLVGGSIEEKQADLTAKLKMIEVVDADGNPVELDATLVLAPAAKAEDETEETDEEMEKRIGRAVAKAFDEQNAKGLQIAEITEKKIKDALAKGHKPTGGYGRNDDEGTAGFKCLGELALAVKNHTTGHSTDARLKGMMTKAPTTYSQTAVGADGGVLIPDDFQAQLLTHAFGEFTLAGRCRRITVRGNSIEMPKDETTPWGTDGVQVNWTGEGVQIGQSKMKLGSVDIKLHKLSALVPVTNELLDDSPIGIDQYLNGIVPQRIAYKIDNAILNGTGAGQPLGIRNSPALKTVSRTTGTGIAIDEIADLLGAIPPESYASPGLAYVMHNLVIPEVVQAKIGDTPVFVPPGGAESARVPGRIMGIPALVHAAAQSYDDAGDLSLHDFNQYLLVTKSDGVRTDVSVHLYFDYSMTAFRFEVRVGGQPWLKDVITLPDTDSTTVSPFTEIGAT